MCDCAPVESSIKTITIYQKSTKLREPVNCEEIMNLRGKDISSDIKKTESCTDDICSTDSSFSKSSTDSTRKFVNQWELECKCERNDEGHEFERKHNGDYDDNNEINEKASNFEFTIAIIKPDALVNRKAIEYEIIENGLTIQQTRFLRMTSEQASEFYSDNYEKKDFANIVTYVTSGPIVVHVLAKKNAIQVWRTLMGPTKVSDAKFYFPESIRARYGEKCEDYKNVVHGSDSRDEAQREIHFFFPDFIIEPFVEWKSGENYLWEFVNKILIKALITCCKERPMDPISWLTNWLIKNNPKTSKLQKNQKK